MGKFLNNFIQPRSDWVAQGFVYLIRFLQQWIFSPSKQQKGEKKNQAEAVLIQTKEPL